MTKVPEPAPASAEEKAFAWRARLDSGDVSTDERLEFERWLAAAPENGEAYRRLQTALEVLDENGAEILAREYERELAALADRPQTRRRWGALAAAAAIVALALPVITIVGRASKPEVFVAGVGEKKVVELADGSRVTLSTDTRMTADMRGDRRAIKLERGEALFVVASDRARPFTVATARAVVVVTGTVFDVRARDDTSSVYVISGAVDVRTASNEDSTLLAGDSIRISAAGASPVERFDPNLVLAWRRDRLKFAETALGVAVGELNRHFATPIALDGAALAEMPLSGDVPTNDQDAAVRAIAMAFDLEVRKEPGRIVLSRKSE